ncbi:odorant receptor 4-like isoform X2 [Halyomorpha halys]|uniref:odorant receptor 4-like isoform X2 n=1 Tax=Halyomorpha halys TaxID=286706 RepID=UPI0006D4E51A
MGKMFDVTEDIEIDKFIDKQYFYLMQISCIYIKLDKRSTMLMMTFNMVLFSQSSHFALLLQLTMILTFYFQTKHRELMLFHKMLSHGFFDYEEPPPPGDKELRSAMLRERRILIMIPTAVALAGGVILVGSPIIDRRLGSFDLEVLDREFSTHLPYPYGKYPYQTKEGFSYYAALAGQIFNGSLLTVFIGTAGFLFLTLAQNVSLQLQLLQNSLQHVEVRAEEMYFRLFGKTKNDGTSLYEDPQFSYCYSTCLRKNFKHHQIILRAFEYTEGIMSAPMFLAYMTGTIVIALSLISTGSVQELPGTTISAMILCGVEVGYIFLLSVFGQRIGDLNMELRFKIYSIKWYLCNRALKSNLLIFQEKTMKPLTIMAGGIVPANMETFATVMNSAYSYYNLANAFGS